MTHSNPIKISASPNKSGAKKISSKIPATSIIPRIYTQLHRGA